MSKLGAVLLTSVILATTPVAANQSLAAEMPHRITHDTAWGCREKHDVFDLLFLGLSTSFNSFDSKLEQALADGRCVYFKSGEDVMILEDSGSHGLVKVQRGGTEPVTYWTPLRNVD